MELTSVGMIKCFVAAGLGVSLISASFARNEVRAGEVKLIPSRTWISGANWASSIAATARSPLVRRLHHPPEAEG